MENNTVLVQILHLLCPCQRKPNTKYQINFVPNVGIFTVSHFGNRSLIYVTVICFDINCHDLICKK